MKNPTLVCASLIATSSEEMAHQMHVAAERGADLVELRLDHLPNFNPCSDLQFLIKDRPLPVITTFRPKWEGGEYEGDEISRFEALRLAMEFGSDYVDIELQAAEEFVESISMKKPENFKLIVSSHNYQNTPSPEQLGDLVSRIQAVGADIVKIATTAVDISDVARLFQVLVHCQVPVIGMVMGERGLVSRLLSSKFGMYLTFCSLDEGKESAPGQPTISELLNLYRIKQTRADTTVLGLISKPVGHSKSPLLHNAALKSAGVNAVYVPFLVDDLPSFLKAFSCPDFAGFSVGIPHKVTAITCCDEVDPIAKCIGAVNTIVRRSSDGKLVGYNTDYVGAISAIEDGIRGLIGNHAIELPLAGRLFVVMGAGGAGKALAYGAKEKGARVIIANRTYDKAKELANLVGGDALLLTDLESFHPEKGMVLANTTSLGMQPNVNETPLAKSCLGHYDLVFDAVYTPKETRLLREAKESGVTVVTGVEMFIRQAMKQFDLFTGMPAPEEMMRDFVMTNI
ncbi:3-dehydroquinate dehydratase type I protein [Dioscorea alata]|uniref:3-dehydroquinate dehydratase type I protein n=1 Tax=Dioscorea alata TaxID=55571 RepID=A0ACB7U207_DIOAL|nr:3-dehydroquinate dehydratase type I protein [Dioscorea alata]